MRSRDRVALPGSDREPVANASSPSPIDNHELAQVTVVLRKRPQTQPAGAEEFGFEDSQEVNYHTREEFAVIHGADPADIALVEAFAHEYSLTVTERSAARRSVVLTGTIENLQKAFGTTLARYETPTGAYPEFRS